MNSHDVFKVFIPNSIIGMGAVESLGTEVRRLGGQKVLIATDDGITRAGLLDRVKQLLIKEGFEVGTFTDCKPDAPVESVKNCAQFAKDGRYDLLIGLGGGSVLDTTKAASILAKAEDIKGIDIFRYLADPKQRGLPKVMIPTTAGTGSEWNKGAVITDDSGIKKVARSDYQLADLTVIDPGLTINLPPKQTADTGMDALAHAIEAYTSPKENIMSQVLSTASIKLIVGNLRTAYGLGSRSIEARYNMSIAAAIALSGMLSVGGAQLPHGMGHALQTKVHCTHGASVSILLPHILEFNMISNLPRFANLAKLMGEKVYGLSEYDGAQKAANAVRRLSSDIGIPQRLRDIGTKREDIPELVDIVFNHQSRSIANNAREVSKEDLKRLYENAW